MKAAASGEHVLERRSHLLAGRIKERIGDMVIALQAADGRIPYRTKLSRGTALDWWAQHRYDTIGQQALQGLSPQAVLELDNELAQQARQKDEQGSPQVVDNTTLGVS